MILIFGGAYQGKLDFAKERFGAGTVYACKARTNELEAAKTACDIDGAKNQGGVPDFSADLICGLDQFVWDCCAEDPAQRIEAADWMRDRKEDWQDKVLIITDVSQGIVPMDARTRAFREMNGRLMMYLASEAEEVWRVFCGIGKRIK